MKALLAIFFLLMLLAVIAKALGYDGIKKSKKEIKIYAGWPTRIVISCFAFIPVAFFFLEPADLGCIPASGYFGFAACTRNMDYRNQNL